MGALVNYVVELFDSRQIEQNNFPRVRANYPAELIDLRPILYEPFNWFPLNRVSLSQFVDFRTIQRNNCLRDEGHPIQILIELIDSGQIELNNWLRANGRLFGRINWFKTNPIWAI